MICITFILLNNLQIISNFDEFVKLINFYELISNLYIVAFSIINYILRIPNKKYDNYNIILAQLNILDKTNTYINQYDYPESYNRNQIKIKTFAKFKLMQKFKAFRLITNIRCSLELFNDL
jgi:hypothetical protein